MKTSILNRNFASMFARTACLVFASLTVVALSGCNMSFTMVDGYLFDRSGETAEATGEGTFSSAITAIEIENKFGNVSIEATDGDATWTHDAKVWADTQELAVELADSLIVEPETVGETLKLKVTLPPASSEFNGVQSDLTLKVPAAILTNLVNGHGNIAISKLTGEVVVKNGHGNIDLTDLSGSLNATCTHGNLIANQLGAAEIKVSHGSTTIESATGNIEFKSSHGNVKANHLTGNVIGQNSHGSTDVATSGENISISSSHGNIRVAVDNAAFKSIELDTSHSSIKLQLPSGSQPNIEMKTTHGKLYSSVDSVENASQHVKLTNSHGNIDVSKLSAGEAQ